MKSILLISFFSIFFYQNLIFAEESKFVGEPKMLTEKFDTQYIYMSKEHYITSSLVGSVLGFGTGHLFVKGRYSKTGWIFTLGETVSVLGFVLTGFVILASQFGYRPALDYEPDPDYKDPSLFSSFLGRTLLTFTVSFFALKTWEIIDLWNLPSSYKISKENQRFGILPITYISNDQSKNFGLSLNFYF